MVESAWSADGVLDRRELRARGGPVSDSEISSKSRKDPDADRECPELSVTRLDDGGRFPLDRSLREPVRSVKDEVSNEEAEPPPLRRLGGRFRGDRKARALLGLADMAASSAFNSDTASDMTLHGWFPIATWYALRLWSPLTALRIYPNAQDSKEVNIERRMYSGDSRNAGLSKLGYSLLLSFCWSSVPARAPPTCDRVTVIWGHICNRGAHKTLHRIVTLEKTDLLD